MIIKKNEKTYTITEGDRDWKVSTQIGVIPVDYRVSKIDCPTLDSLKAFIANNDVF